MPKEIFLFGPPGTGKTYALSKRIEEEGRPDIIACSHTRAAAYELVHRVNLPDENVGTVHSFCYRLLGRPPIAETGRLLKVWNEENRLYAITPGAHSPDEPMACEAGGGALVGTALFDAYNLLRNKLIPRDRWHPAVLAFAKRWEQFKKEHEAIDFTDMLELALAKAYTLNTCAVYVDEAQDLTPLAARTVRSLARNAEKIVWAGDDDQTIYTFAGATPDVMIDMPPSAKQIILKRSFRLAKRIHEYSQQLIRQVQKRVPKLITPRDAEGLVSWVGNDLGAKAVAELVSTLPGYSAILATCGYMLEPVLTALRRQGVVYCNPYRQLAEWNPLSTAEALRVKLFLLPRRELYGREARLWTFAELAKWTEPITAKVMIRNGKSWLAEQASRSPDTEVDLETLTWLFPTTENLGAVLDGDLSWFRRVLRASQKAAFESVLDFTCQAGLTALIAKPKVIVGTIHSVKGAEFDNVVLFGDLSRAGYESATTDYDSITRVMYVGATRAREKLYLTKLTQRTYAL